MARLKSREALTAEVGFAGDGGRGVAYVRLPSRDGGRVARMPFDYDAQPELRGREIGYAALQTVAAFLRERGVRDVRFVVDDVLLARDLQERAPLPAALNVAYMRLRCMLNQFSTYEIVPISGASADLAARARVESAMHIAA